MKAFLLAAGYGTRLKPITDTVPKCMVPIRGHPLLGWWLKLLREHGVKEVLINTHYLPEPVWSFIEAYNFEQTGLTVFESYEPDLLGSGGTIRANRAFVEGEDSFLICYADNLTDADLTDFLLFHKEHSAPLSMALFRTSTPEQCGIAELDEERRIVKFTEKPEYPKSNLANAGMYIADERIFNFLDPSKTPLDFGKDVLPMLVGQMYGWNTKGYLIDIGTMENYTRANGEWEHDYYEDSATN